MQGVYEGSPAVFAQDLSAGLLGFCALGFGVWGFCGLWNFWVRGDGDSGLKVQGVEGFRV